MKIVISIILVWLCFVPAQAQKKIEKHMEFSGKEILKLKIQIADSITLHTWKKNEVFVTASINVNDNKDNEAYETSFDESGNSLVINARFNDKYFKGKKNCCTTSDIWWQIYMPDNTAFSIETINANVTITGVTEEMNVKSISGYVDLAVPANRQADIEFSTISGTIYSNHELALNKTHSSVPSVIKEKLNNGGPAIKLETISGDIFFRKSE